MVNASFPQQDTSVRADVAGRKRWARRPVCPTGPRAGPWQRQRYFFTTRRPANCAFSHWILEPVASGKTPEVGWSRRDTATKGTASATSIRFTKSSLLVPEGLFTTKIPGRCSSTVPSDPSVDSKDLPDTNVSGLYASDESYASYASYGSYSWCSKKHLILRRSFSAKLEPCAWRAALTTQPASTPVTSKRLLCMPSSNLEHRDQLELFLYPDEIKFHTGNLWNTCRRKFRSQISDNMDRWKTEMERVREKRREEEKIREEKESGERRRRCAKR